MKSTAGVAAGDSNPHPGDHAETPEFELSALNCLATTLWDENYAFSLKVYYQSMNLHLTKKKHKITKKHHDTTECMTLYTCFGLPFRYLKSTLGNIKMINKVRTAGADSNPTRDQMVSALDLIPITFKSLIK